MHLQWKDTHPTLLCFAHQAITLAFFKEELAVALGVIAKKLRRIGVLLNFCFFKNGLPPKERDVRTTQVDVTRACRFHFLSREDNAGFDRLPDIEVEPGALIAGDNFHEKKCSVLRYFAKLSTGSAQHDVADHTRGTLSYCECSNSGNNQTRGKEETRE